MSNMTIVYRHEGGSNDLYKAIFNGSWQGDERLEHPKSKYNPGIAVFQGRLYIIYNGQSQNNLYTAWYDGKNWSGNEQIKIGKSYPASAYCPNLVTYQNKLYTVYCVKFNTF